MTRLPFEEMLGYANCLGLYAEQTGGWRGAGKLSQAFAHLGKISAGFNLDRTLSAQETRGERITGAEIGTNRRSLSDD